MVFAFGARVFMREANQVIAKNVAFILLFDRPSFFHAQRGVPFETRDKDSSFFIELIPPVVIAVALIKHLNRTGLWLKGASFINVVNVGRRH